MGKKLTKLLRTCLNAAAILLALPSLAAPVELVEEYETQVKVQLLLSTGEGSGFLNPKEFKLKHGKTRSHEWLLQWPDPSKDSSFKLKTSFSNLGSDRILTIDGKLVLPSGRQVRVRRSLGATAEDTNLVEVFRDATSTLTLAITSETTWIGWVPRKPTVGKKLMVDVFIESVNGSEIIPLESNRLFTFEREQVGYSFRRGAGASLEDVHLMITPIPREDGGYDLQAEISGSLPLGQERVYLQHSERLLLGKGMSTSLNATTGDPPRGYRFRLRLQS